MNGRGPQVDRAVSAFVSDISQRGLDKNILLVISGEFGRTPRINKNAGRDHWGPLSTLALAGGGLNMGQVIGKISLQADAPAGCHGGPQESSATSLHLPYTQTVSSFDHPARRPLTAAPPPTPYADCSRAGARDAASASAAAPSSPVPMLPSGPPPRSRGP